MLKNYFLVALRNVMRNRVYTFLNVFGLALGIACGLIAFWFIRFQTSFDSFHKNADRIYQVHTLFKIDRNYYNRGVPPLMSVGIRKEMPELVASLCVERQNILLAILDQNGKSHKKFKDENMTGAYVEADYFKIFTFPWRVGKPSSMNTPNKIALSETLAKRFFGAENPIGKTIRLENQINLEVVGIFYNNPENSELVHQYYISLETLRSHPDFEYGGPSINTWDGLNSSTYCYALFPKGVSLATMQPRMEALTKKYHPNEYKTFTHAFVPFRSMHFKEEYQNKVIPIRWLWIMGGIGVFLIVTACFNFINMATAQAMRRAKEVGVRKAVGGSNTQIFFQFMTETGIIVFSSLVLGFGIGAAILPNLNTWLNVQMWQTSVAWTDSFMWFTLLGLFVSITLLAGSYPAMVLAGFKPIIALKGSVSTRQIGGVSLRRILIVFQFVWIQLLLVCMLIINLQMNYMQTADMGYSLKALVNINIPQPEKLKQETFKQRMLQIKGVEKFTFCTFPPTSPSTNTSGITYHNRPKSERWAVSTKYADEDYLETYKLKLLIGKPLPKSDTAVGYLVNERVVERLGIANPEEVIGKNLNINGRKAPIYGVVKNWHTTSLQREVEPIAIFAGKNAYYNAGIRLRTHNITQTMREIETLWNEYYPEEVFQRTFIDELVQRLYEQEQSMLNLIRGFSFIAIFIGCLGMFGLVRFLASQKTKEIGVRKAYGATVAQILFLFVSEMVRLIIIAFLIALPIGYYLMSLWLQTYVYRIDLNTQIAIVALIAVIFTTVLAGITIGFEAYKAAIKSPSLSLKTE